MVDAPTVRGIGNVTWPQLPLARYKPVILNTAEPRVRDLWPYPISPMRGLTSLHHPIPSNSGAIDTE
jgi:hypothetical protein